VSSGVEADIALDAAVVASLGLIRVLGGAAGLAAAGTGALASFAEARADERSRRLEEARRLEAAVGEVLDRNARIAALADSARRNGVDVALPAPLEPADRPAGELTAWVARVDGELAEAERSLADAIATAAAGRVFAAVPGSLRAEAPLPGPPADRAASAPHGVLEADLTRVLTRLLPDAADEDRRSVTEAAEQVVTAPTPSEAEGRLTEVRIRVQQANERTRQRRADRAAAARFLRELAGHPAAEPVLAALRAVAEAARPFDEELRAEAVRLVEDVRRQAEHRYVAEAVRAAFAELGYEVGEGFETLTARDGEAVLTRGDWPQHAVKVRVDDARQVRMALLRTEPADGDEQRRLDVEREEQWCASFEKARERLMRAGIRADVRWRIEPGEQRLPVVRRETARRPPRERRRERDR
jgi:hypothetical protein